MSLSRSTALSPRRVVADLVTLRRLTGDAAGAQRVAFTPPWALARRWLREQLAALPVVAEQDEAANLWATLPGRSPRALLIGSHLDSVPNGGWLDGCLGVLAGLEVLRRLAAEGTPPVTVRLVDWADEEGARFGRSLFGSSVVSGACELEALRRLTDAQGLTLAEAVAPYGVDLERLGGAARRLEHAGAYLELHIEQGPVLESLGLPLGVVLGTVGIERHRVTFSGQTAHAGSTPMALRHDAFLAAARLALAARDGAVRLGGVATTGSCVTRPGIPTALAGSCALAVDQRHLDPSRLTAMLEEARSAGAAIAGEEGVAVNWDLLWRIQPLAFHPELIELAAAAVEAFAGTAHRLPSGPLHDAAEMARAGVPTAMLFVQSLRGLSHTAEEDTREEHLELAVRALDDMVSRTMQWIASS
jgi:N-carbamoyl-L-amino-acid hydrolase